MVALHARSSLQSHIDKLVQYLGMTLRTMVEVKSFDGVRHEWLDLHIFESIEEVRQIATEWLWSYNNERPNMGNGGMTPAQKQKMVA